MYICCSKIKDMIKKLLLLAIISNLPFLAIFSQEYEKIDKIVDGYPGSFSKIEKLADQINKDFSSEKDKARAIYRWIAMNIKYDVDAYYSGQKSYNYTYSSQEEKEQKEKEFEKKLAEQALKKKKAVCEGYSTLFKMLCDLTNVECVVIQGYAKIFDKDIGKEPRGTDHAWNAVKINNKWQLTDATWAAGSVDFSKKKFIAGFSDLWFLSSPDIFFLKHFPEDKKWLFADKTMKDFVDLPLFYSDDALSGIEIIKPKKGIIKINSKDIVKFEWKTNLDPKKLNYAFKSDKYAKELQADVKNGVLFFEIPMEKTGSAYLTFYYQNSALLTYKIEKK
jgi:transglutaminase/protease-like cytokinesis protein 3